MDPVQAFAADVLTKLTTDLAARVLGSVTRRTREALGEGDLLQLRQDGMPASTVRRNEFPDTLTQMLTDAGMAAPWSRRTTSISRAG